MLTPAVTHKIHLASGCTVANIHQSRTKQNHKEQTEAELQADMDHKEFWNDRKHERALYE